MSTGNVCQMKIFIDGLVFSALCTTVSSAIVTDKLAFFFIALCRRTGICRSRFYFILSTFGAISKLVLW